MTIAVSSREKLIEPSVSCIMQYTEYREWYSLDQERLVWTACCDGIETDDCTTPIEAFEKLREMLMQKYMNVYFGGNE